MLARHETFEEFQQLSLTEVWTRAQEVEERPRGGVPAVLRPDEVAWRWLYREMRKARAATVGELKRPLVEWYGSRLGYGYFRIRAGRRDDFMPLAAR